MLIDILNLDVVNLVAKCQFSDISVLIENTVLYFVYVPNIKQCYDSLMFCNTTSIVIPQNSLTISCACPAGFFCSTDGIMYWENRSLTKQNDEFISCIGDNVCRSNVCVSCPDFAKCAGGFGVLVNSTDSYYCSSTEHTIGAHTVIEFSLVECNERFCLENNLCGHNRDMDYANNPLYGKCADGYASLGLECLPIAKFGGVRNWLIWLLVNLFLFIGVFIICRYKLVAHIEIMLYFFQTLILVYGDVFFVGPICQFFLLSIAKSIPLTTSTMMYLVIQLANPLVYFIFLGILYIACLLSDRVKKKIYGRIKLKHDEDIHEDSLLWKYWQNVNDAFHFFRNNPTIRPLNFESSNDLKTLRRDNIFFRTFCFLLYATYETWTDQALYILACKETNVGSVLEEYPDVPCHGVPYTALKVVAIFIISFLSIGMPVSFFNFLIWNRVCINYSFTFLHIFMT